MKVALRRWGARLFLFDLLIADGYDLSMKLSVIFIALYTAIFNINCSPIYSVSYDYDRNIDFVNLRTFSWLPIAEEAKINTLDIERIKKSVNAELYKKGLKSATLNPDF